MSKVIEINNLSKVYDLGLVGTGTLSKDLNRTWAKLRGKPDPYATLVELNDRTQKSESNMVYALKDINFSVEQGEVLGIVGKNGAGKSTLLKILSQITSPSTGSIKMKGRVASLLEVGTGMHPEMTAKQNIYLNGSLMGMRRHEITSKLDEIVAFAGIEKYIDTPTKRFSSGMTVRLGFAIAAFLEPEILIVDEVLAVGDAEFQKKAVGKMKDVSKTEGRTVLFVSHNMAAVKSLCTSAILIEKGILKLAGDTERVLADYLIGDNTIRNFKQVGIKADNFEIISIGIRGKNKGFYDPINRDETIELVIEYKNEQSSNLRFTLKFKAEDGQYFMVTGSKLNFVQFGHNISIMELPSKLLNDGAYYLDLLVVKDARYAIIMENDIVSFMANPEERTLGGWMGKEVGYIRGEFEWKNIKL